MVLSFSSWNIRQFSLVKEGDFLSLLHGSSFLGLQEIGDIIAFPSVPGFSVHFQPKFSSQIQSGGVGLWIRQSSRFSATILGSEFSSRCRIFFKVCCAGITLFAACCYFSSCNSAFWDPTCWSELGDEVIRISSVGEVLFFGDFNARIGSLWDYVDEPDELPLLGYLDSFITTSGRRLIDFCHLTGFRVFNGRVPGEFSGSPTWRHDLLFLSSQLDPFLATPGIWTFQPHLRILTFLDRSDNRSLSLTLTFPFQHGTTSCSPLPFLHWTNSSAHQFWPHFLPILNALLSRMISGDDLQAIESGFLSAIHRLAPWRRCRLQEFSPSSKSWFESVGLLVEIIAAFGGCWETDLFCVSTGINILLF